MKMWGSGSKFQLFLVKTLNECKWSASSTRRFSSKALNSSRPINFKSGWTGTDEEEKAPVSEENRTRGQSLYPASLLTHFSQIYRFYEVTVTNKLLTEEEDTGKKNT